MLLNFLYYPPRGGGFNEHQADEIRALWPIAGGDEAGVGTSDGPRVDRRRRATSVVWLDDAQMPAWFAARLSELTELANAAQWCFDVSGVQPRTQLLRYERSGRFGWHVDVGPDESARRKLSVCVQLSDPDDYQGGELEFGTGRRSVVAPRSKGGVVIFPSVLPHRVSPVKDGVRFSASTWAIGPPFR